MTYFEKNVDGLPVFELEGKIMGGTECDKLCRRLMAVIATGHSHLVMDFEKVPTIGQAFADEIFRVFKSKYPKKIVSTINTNEAVQFMIDRVAKITLP